MRRVRAANNGAMTNVSHTQQPGSAPDGQSDWTEEDHAAQIVREVEEEVANLEGEVADIDLLRELILQKLTFAFRKVESAERVPNAAGNRRRREKKPRGRPPGSKNKPKDRDAARDASAGTRRWHGPPRSSRDRRGEEGCRARRCPGSGARQHGSLWRSRARRRRSRSRISASPIGSGATNRQINP